jgi:hypothetical protein
MILFLMNYTFTNFDAKVMKIFGSTANNLQEIITAPLNLNEFFSL